MRKRSLLTTTLRMTIKHRMVIKKKEEKKEAQILSSFERKRIKNKFAILSNFKIICLAIKDCLFRFVEGRLFRKIFPLRPLYALLNDYDDDDDDSSTPYNDDKKTERDRFRFVIKKKILSSKKHLSREA